MVDQVELRIMVVSPFAVERSGLRALIESHPRYRVVAEAGGGNAALALANETEVDVAIIDYSLADTTGLGLSHLLTFKHPRMQILLYTDRNSRDRIVEALREGARAFVLKSEASRHLLPALAALVDHRPYWEGAIEPEILDQLLEPGPSPPPDTMSSRERQVLQLVAEGRTTKDMARALGVSTKTIESFRTSVRRKLGLRSVADLGRYAVKHDIIRA